MVSAAVGQHLAAGVSAHITATTGALAAALIILVVVLMILCVGNYGSGNGQRLNAPPSPPADSCLFGHVNILKSSSPLPWVELDRIGKKHGDVMSLKLGGWTIMLNTFAALKDSAVNYVQEMGSRHSSFTADLLSEKKDISLGAYSPEWLLQRKMGIQNLSDFATDDKLDEVAQRVFKTLANDLDQKEGKPVNIKDIVIPAVAGILSHLCFGLDADPTVHERIAKLMGGDLYSYIVGPRIIADGIPFLKHFPSSGVRKAKETVGEFIGLLRSELQRHKETNSPDNVRSLMDGMIMRRNRALSEDPEKYGFLTDTHVYQVVSNYIGGTTAGLVVTSTTAGALLVSYPDAQEQISAEVTKKVGEDGMPSLKDRQSLVYTRAATEEILRYACIAPIGVPHATTQKFDFRGYTIPNHEKVLYNCYGVHFNEIYWPEPFVFKPERFLDPSGNFQPDEHMFPFGFGARKCLAENEARKILYLLLTWVTHRYALSRAPGDEEKDLLTQDLEVKVARAVAPFDLILHRRF